MPPLREHKEDIPAIIEAMLTDMNAKHGRQVKGSRGRDAATADGYDWPGNVRELRNTVERAVILCGKGVPGDAGTFRRASASAPRGRLRPRLPRQRSGVHVEIGTTVDQAERKLILKTLESTRNNKTRAAEILGISLKTLHNKLKEYGSSTSSEDGGRNGR